MSLTTVLLWFCILGCALLGGLYFAFSAFIMKALREAGQAGVVAMNAINRVILRSAFMAFFFGTTLASGTLVVLGAMNLREASSPGMILGGVLYVAGMFAVTMLANVPLNNALQNVTAESRTGTAIWNDYLHRWTRWNHVRTLSSMGASALFLFALLAR
ncbi:MAG TPA: anthrone oxygenase family protein [Steroidobacteraceae bacterium]